MFRTYLLICLVCWDCWSTTDIVHIGCDIAYVWAYDVMKLIIAISCKWYCLYFFSVESSDGNAVNKKVSDKWLQTGFVCATNTEIVVEMDRKRSESVKVVWTEFYRRALGGWKHFGKVSYVAPLCNKILIWRYQHSKFTWTRTRLVEMLPTLVAFVQYIRKNECQS